MMSQFVAPGKRYGRQWNKYGRRRRRGKSPQPRFLSRGQAVLIQEIAVVMPSLELTQGM
jgi:hypothetical protein